MQGLCLHTRKRAHVMGEVETQQGEMLQSKGEDKARGSFLDTSM